MTEKYSQAIIRTGVNSPRKTKKSSTPSVSARARRNNSKTKRVVVKFHVSIPKPRSTRRSSDLAYVVAPGDHYKNERYLSFTAFLAKIMLTLFKEEDKPMTEVAK